MAARQRATSSASPLAAEASEACSACASGEGDELPERGFSLTRSLVSQES